MIPDDEMSRQDNIAAAMHATAEQLAVAEGILHHSGETWQNGETKPGCIASVTRSLRRGMASIDGLIGCRRARAGPSGARPVARTASSLALRPTTIGPCPDGRDRVAVASPRVHRPAECGQRPSARGGRRRRTPR
jgi:hypothetical protein